jgi:flagellin-like hook-associated protein FlgL
MAGTIVLSAAVRSNLLALQQTSDLISQTQERLATGKKVNSALDNPSNFFTASGLTDRANDLSGLLDSISNGLQTIQAANNGITSLTNLVQTALATLRQAQQSAATTAKVAGSVTGLTASSPITLTGNVTITDGNNNSVTIAAANTSTVQDILNQVNSPTSTAAVKAELTGDGRIQFEATGATSLTIAGANADLVTLGLATAGATVSVPVAAGTLNSARTSLASQFDTLRTQIDQLAGDSGYNGVNLLNGDALKVLLNEKSTSSVTISGVKFTSAGLGISASTNGFQSDFDINSAITNVTNALATLRSQASTFGANLSIVQIRQDFTKATINTLQTGADNLTLADTNQEGANLLSLQTRQQLSSTALSIASQSDRNVLSLFR